MSALGFPMLSGVEGASYAANSGPQNSVLLRCRPMIERAIAIQQARLLELKQLRSNTKKKAAAGSFHGVDQLIAEATAAAAADDDDDEKVFRIADMGSSSGPNCLANMQFMLEAIKKHELPSSYEREMQFFFCDLPSNDFNTLMQLQHADNPNMHPAGEGEDDGKGKGGGGHRCCFGAAVGGTVYGRLFPASSLHLVFSSCCLHWLSQTPKSISTSETMEWNPGKIWVDGPLANEATGRAYAHQWQQDLNVFFRCRNAEMVKGGMMILVIPCRDDSFPPHQMQKESCFRNLELAWQQLIQEGNLEQIDLDTFNIPKYLPTIQEIINAVRLVPNFRIQSLEVIEEAIGDNYWRQWSHDPNEWATRVNDFYKSAFWNVIERHVGITKCEAIFERFKLLLKTSLQNQSCWESYWAHPWSSYAALQVFKDI
ncbi:hypothetical protein GOP47_0018876 [Adiantum capillus-veneris]|uniref:Uncharacterized protein n=1 Tax=Adiantum capillus-veneris TaxID=13818 RepID=A0A9D4UEM2_ADICA|nr:hypothetical protein GOP47_0018876 [Adiantum capillus-veneris]